jgi:hypothetical protein
VSRTLNFVLGFSLLGAVLFSLFTPYVISVLFTPPVSFGTNCEPAAAWSMSKMHVSETTGLILGAIGGLVLALMRKKKQKDAAETPSPGHAPSVV